MLRVTHAVLHIFDVDTGEVQISERELDLEERRTRSYVQRMLRRMVTSPDNRTGSFSAGSNLAPELQRYFQGQRSLVDLSSDVARTTWEQLRRSEDADPSDLLVADFTDTEAASSGAPDAPGEKDDPFEAPFDEDAPGSAPVSPAGEKDDPEDRERRFFAVAILPRRKSYQHELSVWDGKPGADLMQVDATLPNPTQKVSTYALVDAQSMEVFFKDEGVQIGGQLVHVLTDELLRCSSKPGPREVVDTVVRIAGEVAEQLGRNPAVAMAETKDYVSHSAEQEARVTPAEVGEHIFADEPELAERFEEALGAEELPEEVPMRPSVARRLAKSHRIRTDTGIDITFPSAYAADQHFIEFSRTEDGTIEIRIRAQSIENR